MLICSPAAQAPGALFRSPVAYLVGRSKRTAGWGRVGAVAMRCGGIGTVICFKLGVAVLVSGSQRSQLCDDSQENNSARDRPGLSHVLWQVDKFCARGVDAVVFLGRKKKKKVKTGLDKMICGGHMRVDGPCTRPARHSTILSRPSRPICRRVSIRLLLPPSWPSKVGLVARSRNDVFGGGCWCICPGDFRQRQS